MRRSFINRIELKKKAAAFMSAVLLFTSGAEAISPVTQVFAAGEETGTETLPAFSISASSLQYGEDGSNAGGNLDAVFSPCLISDGNALIPGTDYTIVYKFFTDKESAEAITADTFDAADSATLSEIPAGTTVYAVACAQTADARFLADAEIAIEKRKISISYAAAEGSAIEGRDVSENGIYVLPETEIDYSGFTIDAAAGFAYTLDADTLLAGDIVLDLSGVDLSKDSLSTVPMEAELDPDIGDNYELDGNIHGNLYINKAQYYVVFLANNNGQTYTKTYAFPGYEYNGTVKELLASLGKTEEILNTTKDGLYDLNGFIDTDTEALIGWTVYSDGFNAWRNRLGSDYQTAYSSTVNLNADATTYEHDDVQSEYHLNGYRDYLFVAQVCKAAAKNIFVSAIPAVSYDGREHIDLGTKGNLKKQVPDLRIVVNYSYDAIPGNGVPNTELKPGTDYTIKYFNNVNASVKLKEDGTYEQLKTGEDRPHVVLTGAGAYKGFCATVYFDILPVNLGATEYTSNYIHEKNDKGDDPFKDHYYRDKLNTYIESESAELHGLEDKQTVLLKKGKVSGIKLKVTKGFWTSATDYEGNSRESEMTRVLTKDKDYTLEIYKFNESGRWELQAGITDPNKITSAGRYLVLVRGTGNYCGAKYDRSVVEDFNTGVSGSTRPGADCASSYQFIVSDSGAADLAFSKVTVGKRSIAYDGDYHTGESFDITVKDADGNVLQYDIDYYVTLENRYYRPGSYGKSYSAKAANVYDVMIYGKGRYYGEKSAKSVCIKGLRLKKAWFAREGERIKLTEKGVAAKIVMEGDKDPYFVGYSATVKKGTRIITVGGENCGEAIDPAKPVVFRVKIPKKAKAPKISLKKAVEQGLISFEVSDKGSYNVKGAVPQMVAAKSKMGELYIHEDYSYSGYTIRGMYIVDSSGYYHGFTDLRISFKNNRKVGATADVVVKVTKSDIFSGSMVVGHFTVEPRYVDDMISYHEFNPDLKYAENGRVFSLVTDEQKGRGSLDKPNVRLYQVYIDNKGECMMAALGANQYVVHTDKEYGNNHNRVYTYVTAGSEEGFIFADKYEPEAGGRIGIGSGDYCLYDKKLSVKDISAVTIDGIEYPVKNGVIDKKFSPVFTGTQLLVSIESVRIGDKTLKVGYDYRLQYSGSCSAGEKSGNIGFRTIYNSSRNTYEFCGNVMLRYSISPAEAVKL